MTSKMLVNDDLHFLLSALAKGDDLTDQEVAAANEKLKNPLLARRFRETLVHLLIEAWQKGIIRLPKD